MNKRKMAIILLTGSSATGKTTLAKEIGRRLAIPVVGEREILRRLAREYGFSRTRYWVRKVGIDTALDEALVEILETIKRTKTEREVILDGSYDYRLPQILAQEFDDEKEIRTKRMEERMGVTVKRLYKRWSLLMGLNIMLVWKG